MFLYAQLMCTFLLLCAGGYDDNIALPSFFVCSWSYARCGVSMKRGIRKVLYLSIADFFFWIHYQDVTRNRVHNQRVGNGSTYIAGTKNSNL